MSATTEWRVSVWQRNSHFHARADSLFPITMRAEAEAYRDAMLAKGNYAWLQETPVIPPKKYAIDAFRPGVDQVHGKILALCKFSRLSP